MSKQVAIAISVSCGGDGIVTYTYVPPPSPMTNNNAPEAVPQVIALASGLNTIPVPAGTARCLLVPATLSGVAKNVKTTSGDVGIVFTSDPVLIPLTGVSTLYVNAASAEALSVVWG